MTGRARGRARGRSRGQAAAVDPKPGEKLSQATPTEPQVGRGGRGRAAPQQKPTQVPPAQPPVQQMAKMSVKEETAAQVPTKEPTPPASGASIGRSTGRGFSEPYTRPEHIKVKTGESGTPISVMSNFIALKNRPDTALFQYHVNFSPPVESKRVRNYLVYHREDLFGKTRVFDGMILYLPIRLANDVTTYHANVRDGSTIQVTVTLTNELSANSPICIQLFNILFRR